MTVTTAIESRAAAIGGHERLLVLALLGLAAAVRLHDVNAGGIWLDEGYSLLQSERSLADILALRRFDANPPLYLLVLHLWRSAFGPGVLAASMLSVVMGVAGTALTWSVMRLRFGRTAGLVAGLLVALSRFHLHYSQEIRGYALLFALVAAADLFYVRFETHGRVRDRVLWALAGFAAVATHTFAWWVLAVQALLAARRRAALVTVGVVLVASTPLLLTLLEHLRTFRSQTWIPAASTDALVNLLWVLGGCGPIATLVWALAVLGIAAHLLPRPPGWLTRDGALPGWRTAAVPAAQLALPFVVFVVSLVVLPMLVDRYLLLSLLPLAGLAGAGVAALRLPVARGLLVAALVALSVGPLREQYAQVERTALAKELSALIAAEYRPGDVVLYSSKHDYVPFVATHPATMEEYLLPAIEGANASTALVHYVARRVRREAPERGTYTRLWLVRPADQSSAEVTTSDWFVKLAPRLEWQHPSGRVLRFALD
jgi:hypothetical protein